MPGSQGQGSTYRTPIIDHVDTVPEPRSYSKYIHPCIFLRQQQLKAPWGSELYLAYALHGNDGSDALSETSPC
jgi:hypothetical protein